jgi:hypothetical protein
MKPGKALATGVAEGRSRNHEEQLELRRLIGLGLTRTGTTWHLTPATAWRKGPPGPRPDSPNNRTVSRAVRSAPGPPKA